MTPPIAYGIDFGTTNSLLSVATDDRVDLLTVDGDSELLPSLVYLHRHPLRSAGTDAARQYANTATARTRCGNCSIVESVNGLPTSDCYQFKVGSACFDSRLIAEIKRDLSDPGRDATHSWARHFDYPDLVGTLLRTLKRRADKALRADVRRVVIGHPVAFAGTEGRGFAGKQALARARLLEGARRAGFSEIELLEEPAAAVSIEDDAGIILAADFGGGTFDVALIQMTRSQGRVLALAGAPVGGEDLDGELFQSTMFPMLGLEYSGKGRVPNRYRAALGRRSRAVRLLADPDLPTLLKQLRSVGDREGVSRLHTILMNGRIYDLYAAVERAKIALSTDDETVINFDHPGLTLSVPVSRLHFEKLIHHHLELVAESIQDALDYAGIAPHDVDLVAATGGSSQLPAFRDMLIDLFSKDRVQARDPYSAIALGLGLYARRLWRE